MQARLQKQILKLKGCFVCLPLQLNGMPTVFLFAESVTVYLTDSYMHASWHEANNITYAYVCYLFYSIN